jgi:hypothetical protein
MYYWNNYVGTYEPDESFYDGCEGCNKKDEMLDNVKKYFTKIVDHLYGKIHFDSEDLEDAIEELRLELHIKANNDGQIQIEKRRQ